MNVEKTFNGLPGWAKGAIAVGALGLTTIIGFKIYNAVKRNIALGKEKQTGKEIDKAIDDAKASGKPGPTLSSAQLSILADQIATSFGTFYENTDTIYRAIDQLKNDADILTLIKIYGIRSIASSIPFVSPFVGTLPEALANYVPQSSIWGKSLNDLNENLAKKGITIKF